MNPAIAPCAIVILAAGASSRMGRPKQLLPVEGQPLLTRAVAACLDVSAWPVVVVLGAHAGQVRPSITRFPVLIAENEAWSEGMASSIRTGLSTVSSFSRAIDAVMITLCDQPALRSATLQRLIDEQRRTNASIVAARYGGRLAVPALFTRRHFPALAALSGDEGARSVLNAAPASTVTAVDCPELAVDFDTPEDYARYLATNPATPSKAE